MTDPDSARHQVWATLILAFFRYPQAIAMVLVVGLIAPMMISYDLRSKAYLMYFSRPLTPGEYIVGKTVVVWFFLVLIATMPALALYVLGVLLSPDLSVIGETWDIPLRILAATGVLVIPTTALATLLLRVHLRESIRDVRVVCHVGNGWRGLQNSDLCRPTATVRPSARRLSEWRPRGGGPPWQQRRVTSEEWEQWYNDIDVDKWRLLSPYDTLGKVESWVFGLDTTPASVIPAMTLLLVITVACVWVVRNRIVARLSV